MKCNVATIMLAMRAMIAKATTLNGNDDIKDTVIFCH